MLDQVITVSEAAALKGCSDRYIRKMCETGKYICRKSSDGVWLILRSSITKENAK